MKKTIIGVNKRKKSIRGTQKVIGLPKSAARNEKKKAEVLM